VPEVSRWNLDLYDNEICDSIHKPEVKHEIAEARLLYVDSIGLIGYLGMVK